MSIATVPTNKLPFAIQTILGKDDKQFKISERERTICESYLSKKNCNKGSLPQYPIIDSVIPHHVPYPSIKTELEVTLSPPINHSKFIHNSLLASNTEVQDYRHHNNLPFSVQYSPIRYGFASTSVITSDRLGQPSKFSNLSSLSDIKFGKLSADSQLCFPFYSDLFDSKIIKPIGNKQAISYINLNYEHNRFCSDKNLSSFPIVITSLGCTADNEGCDPVKPQKTNRRNSSTISRHIGYSYQSQILARYKKPRTSFTKKQVYFSI